jgi:hypothetical protein
LGYAIRKTYVNGYEITPLGIQVFTPPVVKESQIAVTSPEPSCELSHFAETVNPGIEEPIFSENGGKPPENLEFSTENREFPRPAAATTSTTTKINLDPEVAAVVAARQSEISETRRQAAKGPKRKRLRQTRAAGLAVQLEAGSAPGDSLGGAGKASSIAACSSDGERQDGALLVEKNQKAFRTEGIGINRRVLSLCRREHVSPEFIHAQANRLRDEKRFSPNLLVFVIERDDPLPEDREAQERRRYLDNAYSHLINS